MISVARISGTCRRVALACAALWLAAAYPAQAQAVRSAEDHPPVWVARSPDHPTLILLPTIHALAIDDPRVNAALASLATGVQAIVLETHTQPTPEDTQTIKRIGLYPASDSLANHVSSMTAESLARCARESGADIRTFFQTKPWLAGFAVEAVRLHQWQWVSNGGKRAHFVKAAAPLVFPGIDERLETLARHRQIPLIYLETMEQGMQLFDDMPAADQEAFLQGVCTGLHGGRSPGEVSYESFQSAWAVGDAAALERLANARYPGESDAHYDFSQYLFARGTDIFAATLAQDGYFYGKGPILVAVGAGHFFGERSLLQHLRDAGYTITPPATAPQLAPPHEVAAR
ncbi:MULTISPECIES: TraB/GumN family protein [unclassified Paraburkholderia]|uniref:TraB/GumN family protein n=1 Tax=unclassified Paraburkholderia TaxID=2615204 RepID=UPI002AB11EAC|nr:MULTISPECIES: TraB/GumN family protein [unclassified Paraburkholderia]